ncbi:L,D-transpeptidase family protein [Rufibacter latericius]|uniref:L,D-TPase catalytic domain-containing protein n=1 Tax=Rufibacter latericius TaxID=2487040 RepID=A0A3M9M9E8_9BACT|nr:L,D-transpeptidase family protein [Rufibacter latericius]RNI21807.1 hypothetical protein EFB08_21915 [Rufibacter latericius]
MKNLLLLLCLGGLFLPDGFKEKQLQHERVSTAYREKHLILEKLLQGKGLSLQHLELYLRAFKHEKTLEVWARNSPEQAFQLLTSYELCARSGTYGPKRQEGDGQIPEGFYVIDRFNPKSNYHLSLGINYPNASDKLLGHPKPGGDIFLHGDCVTLGCLALTDDKIKELYVLAVEAYAQGQTQIPVHLFPIRFDSPAFAQVKKKYAQNPKLFSFWENLQTGYFFFEQHKTLPTVTVNSTGNYVVE